MCGELPVALREALDCLTELVVGEDDDAALAELRCGLVEPSAIQAWSSAPVQVALLPSPVGYWRGRPYGLAELVALRAQAFALGAQVEEAGWPNLEACGLRVTLPGVPSTKSPSARAPATRLEIGPQSRITAAVITRGDRPALLAEALESVLAQRSSPDEILVVEDVRNAATADVVRRWSKRVRFVAGAEGAPRGQAATLNRAIENAREPWIAWLDDDDRWAPMKLAWQRRHLEETPSAVVFATRYAIQDGAGETQAIAPAPPLERRAPLRLLWHGSLVAHPTTLVRRDLYDRVGRYDDALLRLADWDFLIRALRVGSLAYDPRPLTWVRRHSGNQRRPEVERAIQSAAQQILLRLRASVALEEMAPELQGGATGPEANRVRGELLLERASALIRTGLPDAARDDLQAIAPDAGAVASEATLTLGLLALRERTLDLADTQFRTLGTREGELPPSLRLRLALGRGLLASLRDDWESADHEFAQAATLDPTNLVARSNLLLQRFQVPGLESPLQAEVESLVRDCLLRLRPRDLGWSLLEPEDPVGRPIG